MTNFDRYMRGHLPQPDTDVERYWRAYLELDEAEQEVIRDWVEEVRMATGPDGRRVRRLGYRGALEIVGKVAEKVASE